MKKISWCSVALLTCLLLRNAYACNAVDDTGHVFQLPHPAQRVISLAPDLTEILFSIGAEKSLVGVVRGSDYPEAAKKIPVVASFNALDIERIVALHPDLVVVWADSHWVAQLTQLGIPVYVSHPQHLTAIPRTMLALGCLTGTQKTAEQTANHFLQRYQTLQKKSTEQKRVTVFYELWPEPLVTISHSSWINEIITLCGGKNIFAELTGAAPEVSMESVIRANPDVIIASKTTMDLHEQWQRWPQLTAVKKNKLFALDPDLVERAGPRIIDGAEEMCAMLNK